MGEDIHHFHMFESLGGEEFGIRELTVEADEQIKSQAAMRIPDEAAGKVGHLLAVMQVETGRLKRLSCLAEWDGKPVLQVYDSIEELLTSFNLHQMQLLDRAIDKVNDLNEAELAAFDKSHRRPGAVVMSPSLLPASAGNAS